MTKFELMQARSYSESTLINILMDLGANVQYIIGHRREGQMGPIGFQVFWADKAEDYDARAHANVIP